MPLFLTAMSPDFEYSYQHWMYLIEAGEYSIAGFQELGNSYTDAP